VVLGLRPHRRDIEAAVIAMPDSRPSNEDRIRAALWFAEHGFGVFSVWSADPDGTCRCAKRSACGSPGKHPIGHQGFHDCTRDPTTIRTLLSAASEPNYGLVCPDGVFVWDVDGDGVPRLAELEARLGPLPPTLRTITANGQHVFLRWPDHVPRPIGQMFGYVTRWGHGSGAGYVVGPRSVHPSGAVYTPAGPVTDIAEIPAAWASELVAPPEQGLVVEFQAGGYTLPEPGYDGSRYDAIRDYAASRYMRGVTREEVLAGVLGVLAPRFAQPLSEADLRSRFDRAWRGTAERLGPPQASPESERAVAAAAERAAPQPTSDEAWPEPPAEAAWHGVLGEITRSVAGRTEADPVGILGTLLATVGACMGHGRYIYQGSAQSANLFVVLVGESSSGRKGTAGSVAREVMEAAHPEWSEIVVAGLGSGEGLIGHLRQREKLNDHRALVMETEFGRLLTVMAREGSTLSPVVRDAWDGVPMGRFLAREQALVRYHHVGVVAHVTPVELRQKLSGTDAANGFGNRFLWLSVRRSRLVPFPESPIRLVDPELLADLGASIAEAQAPGEVPWSPAARDAWEDLYLELTVRRDHGLHGALVARREAQIVRLALVYALVDRSRVIDAVHLAAGRAVWDYAERSVGHVFGHSTGDRHADALRDLLADGPIPWEQAKRSLGMRTAADLQSAVDLLRSLGAAEVVRIRESGAKRPVQVIRRSVTTTTTTTTVQGTRAGMDQIDA
jgi:hypothetical protein